MNERDDGAETPATADGAARRDRDAVAPSPTRAALMTMSTAALEGLMRRGHGLTPEDLAGFSYRGTALALPRGLRALVGKFKKAFWADEERGRVRGWNLRMRQNGPNAPWVAATFAGRPVIYGHFLVLPGADGSAADYPGAVLLDYARGEPRLSPLAPIRDHLVSLEPIAAGRPAERVLGRMVLAFGTRVIPTPSYFLLERDAPVGAPPPPPRWSPLTSR